MSNNAYSNILKADNPRLAFGNYAPLICITLLHPPVSLNLIGKFDIYREDKGNQLTSTVPVHLHYIADQYPRAAATRSISNDALSCDKAVSNTSLHQQDPSDRSRCTEIRRGLCSYLIRTQHRFDTTQLPVQPEVSCNTSGESGDVVHVQGQWRQTKPAEHRSTPTRCFDHVRDSVWLLDASGLAHADAIVYLVYAQTLAAFDSQSLVSQRSPGYIGRCTYHVSAAQHVSKQQAPRLITQFTARSNCQT